MSNAVNENKNINANQITSSENYEYHNNMNTEIKIETKNEDKYGQHTLIDINRSIKDKKIYDENNKYSESCLLWKDLYPQVLACSISLLLVIQPGINLAHSNNLLHYMPSLNNKQFSWITSVLALCTPIGAFLIGPIMDKIGRKKACLLACLPLLASWITVAMINSDNIYMFIISRIFAGIGAGMTTVVLVYVSEISHPSYKQILLSLNSVFFSGGVLISTSLVCLEWHIVNLTFIGLTIANILLIITFLPESPVWLLKFKSSENTTKAKEALKRIYPKNKQVFKAEWKRLIMMSNSDINCLGDNRLSFIKSVRSSPAIYKPMVILMGLLLLQQLSGAYPTLSYALPILKSIHIVDQSVSEIGLLAILGVIRFTAGLLACLLSFYVGRKPLLIFSCTGMALSSVLVTFTYDPTSHDRGSAELTKLPLSVYGIMLYIFSSSLGVLVFPWTMICELLPTSVKAIGGSLLVSYAYLLMFAVMKLFPYVLEDISVSNVFQMFNIVSLLMATYVYFIVPETLGKHFQEIEDHFTRSN